VTENEMLPTFALRGWPDGPRRFAGQSSGDRSGKSLESYVAASQQFGDSYVELHVARPDGHLPEFRSWVVGNLIRAAMRSADRRLAPQCALRAADVERSVQAGQSEWRHAKVQVDGASVDFEHLPIGESKWIAIASMPDAHLGLGARGVSFDDLGLVRIASLVRIDLEVPDPLEHRLERPREPDRRFPAELLAGADWTAEANVELVYENYETLSGSVDGNHVELQMEVPHSLAAATGTVGGHQAAVTWSIGDNYNNPRPVGTLRGTYAGLPVQLDGVFFLEPSPFDHADIEGRIGDAQLTARVERVGGGLGSSDTVAADGTFAGMTFTLYGAVSSDLTRAVVGGVVGDHSVRLECDVQRDRSRTAHITGTYHGPLLLLVLVVGTTLYFV
jgi:hypothetical protein